MRATNEENAKPQNTLRMKIEQILRGSKLALLAMLLLAAPSASAGLREPDAVIWGSIYIANAQVTAANTDVVVEARRTAFGPPIASYRMGAQANAGNYYSLRLAMESGAPLDNPNSVIAGDAIVLVARDASGDIDSKAFTVGTRGSVTRVDFGSLDTDSDGMLDNWESQYFGVTGADPNADPDNDLASNLREFLEGTNPLEADSLHPADRDPANSRITINEVTAYGLAWKTSATWATGPNPIPVSYVTRAGALWKGGEAYELDLDVAITPPLWWTNTPTAGFAAATAGTNQIRAAATGVAVASSIQRRIEIAPGGLATGFIVRIEVAPSSTITAYAIEEKIPDGWDASQASNSGTVSAANKSIRWGIYFDSQARSFTYRLAPPSILPADSLAFTGLGSFDGVDVTTAGIVNLDSVTGRASLEIVANPTAAGVTVTLRGVPGQTVSLQGSPDLEAWDEVASVTIDQFGEAEVSLGADQTAVFLRARSE